MGYGLDEKGLKMSKSKGNALDPLPIIEKFGADTFRFWSASEVNHGNDFRCSEQKIEATKKFLTKLWNVSRFLSSFPMVESADLADTDKWIISELDKLVKDCKVGFDEYNFFIPAIAIREFTWNVRQRNVPSVALPSLLGKKEPSIPGWTLVSRHYSLQNSKRMRSFSKELTQPQ